MMRAQPTEPSMLRACRQLEEVKYMQVKAARSLLRVNLGANARATGEGIQSLHALAFAYAA